MLILKTIHVFSCSSNCGNYSLSFSSADVVSDCSYALAYSLQWPFCCSLSVTILTWTPSWFSVLYFSLYSFCCCFFLLSSIYDCHISSAVCVCWCHRAVLCVCCLVYYGKWCCVGKRFAKERRSSQSVQTREQVIWQLLVGFAGGWR